MSRRCEAGGSRAGSQRRAAGSVGAPSHDDARVDAVQAAELMRDIEAARAGGDAINAEERMYAWQETDYTRAADLARALEPFQALWTTAQQAYDSTSGWLTAPLKDVHAASVAAAAADMDGRLAAMAETFRAARAPAKAVAEVRSRRGAPPV